MRLAPFSPAHNHDPAATWARLYAGGQRVGYDDDLGMWLITGHDNVRQVLSDTTRFSNATTMVPITAMSHEAAGVLAGLDVPPVAVIADPPDHLRTRSVLRTFFATTAVGAQQQWGPMVTARVDQLVTDLIRQDMVDMTEFATELSLRVILEILGLPLDDAATIRARTDDLAQLTWGNPDPRTQLACARSSVALWLYCADRVTDRSQPSNTGDFGDGLIGDLLRYRNGNDANLTIAEVAALTLNIIGAGWETTAGALGQALHHALAEPDRWARLAHDEHALHLHVEESLRHSPAVDGWSRHTTTDVTIDGITIPAASRCLVLIGAANHDPDIYTDAHMFDPNRARAGQHLGFGSGPHYCIGAALARLELTTALRALARALPDLTLTEGHRRQFKANAALRQHTSLPTQTRPSGQCPLDRHRGPTSA